MGEGSRARVGEKMVLAKELVGAVAEAGKFTPRESWPTSRPPISKA